MPLEDKAKVMKELDSAGEEGMIHRLKEGKTEEDDGEEVVI